MNISEFLIDENISMLEAMDCLDKVAKKILFVLKDERFVATITDGDIRRWILKKGNLVAKVKDIANYNPRYIYEKDKNTAKNFMEENGIPAVPVLDENRNIISIIFFDDFKVEKEYNFNIPVVIMAGGKGTRLYPYTKILPKPLIPIGEIPIIEHIVNRFYRYGARDFYFIVNHKKNMIKAYFNELNKQYKLNYIDEDIPLGTGGGLSLLKGKITSTFILSNCDILIEEDYESIYKFHKEKNNLITMVCSLKNIKIPYGVIDINESGEIENIKEKPEIVFFTNTGMYIVEPKVIQDLKENENIGFPDIIDNYRKKGEKIGVFPIGENSWLDMGQFDEMERMIKRLEEDE